MSRLEYLETSAATGHNVAKAVELLLDLVMKRMDNAVDKAMLPGHKSKSKGFVADEADNNKFHSKCIC